MNQKFQNYVSEKSFVLTLTRSQSNELISLIEHGAKSRGAGSVARNGLHRRGLIETRAKSEKMGDSDMISWYDAPTTAGLLVYQLLVEAGEREVLNDRERELAALEKERWRLEAERFEREHQVTVRLKVEENKKAIIRETESALEGN